jgi:hypothetical protein
MRSRRVSPGWAVGLMLMLALPGMAPATAQVLAVAKVPAAPASNLARTRSLDDEVQVVAPGGPVMLAQEFELKLQGETNALNRISVTQWVETAGGEWREVYQGFMSGPGERRGDAMVVKVAPYQLGKVQLRVIGTGKTGDELEMLHKDVWVEVAAPVSGPMELRFAQAGTNAWEQNKARVMTQRIGWKGAGGPSQIDLGVSAVYDGVLEPQPVNAQEVQYRVRSSGQVIALDEHTGIVRGLKAGRALVEASYGGATKLACVVVGDSGTEPADCRDLSGR